MLLIFNEDAIPRTTTRDEWKKIDRWRRATQWTLRRAAEERRLLLDTFGTDHPDLRAKLVAEMTDPPMTVYPPI